MNLNAVARRISKIEQRGRSKAKNIKVAYMIYGKWAVLKDYEEFDTLAEAINYIKDRYTTKTIEVCQLNYVLSHMDDEALNRLIKILTHSDQPLEPHQQKLFNNLEKQINVPCAPLSKLEHDNPNIEFKLFLLSEDQTEAYLKAKP